ncbi:DUF4189 domain-containing protein [Devosia sp. SL43]|uniref:DUF4189 domain-containing protein n=1 Tax=Devosia sp. SL43 TaxID=2806348 RepID=UPI001F2D17CA|nr:DUF4189 domain-containing protein [Devosia sp. SL43]UJW84430.1 hypothetical protein IM737_13445 [Devosia sp. SL43]
MRAFLRTLLAVALLLASYPVSVAQAAFSPKQMGPECVEIYRDWLTQPSPRAFALSTNNVDCGAAWAHTTVDEARTDALDRCNSTGAPGCVVVAEDATPLPSVTVGDAVLIGDCTADYAVWLEQAGPKSFYATEDGRSCGSAWSYDTLQQTRKEARRLCVQYGDPCTEISVVE